MTDAELEGAEEQAEASESSASEGAESTPDEETQPEIEADEQADVGGLADLAEQVEDEAGASSDEDDSDTETDSEDDLSMPARDASTKDSWGDLYVGTVTTGLNAVIDEYGEDGAEHIDESLARDLNLDVYVNKWMAEQDRGEMDPGKGMLISTATLCITVLMTKTDLPQKALAKAQDHD